MALIVVGIAVMPLRGEAAVGRVTLAYRRVLIAAGRYSGETARVTIDARCLNVSVQAFGSTWFGTAPWPATVTEPNPHPGTLRRAGFNDATFNADGGGRITMTRLKHNYFLTAECQLE